MISKTEFEIVKARLLAQHRGDGYGHAEAIALVKKASKKQLAKLHTIKNKLRGIRWASYQRRFKNIFGVEIPVDVRMNRIGFRLFDVIEFNLIMRTPEGISLSDHVAQIHGEPARDLLSQLMREH